MRIFISWSKPGSHSLATHLRDWLPEVIQQVRPWLSTEDIAKGQRWSLEIAKELEASGQGLICVTSENVSEAWLNFETGALAKWLDSSAVRPVLLGIEPHEVTGPLAQFQATRATDRDDMLRLVKSINDSCSEPLAEGRLTRAFDRTWEAFTEKVAEIHAGQLGQKSPARDVASIVAEVLDRVRGLERRITDQFPLVTSEGRRAATGRSTPTEAEVDRFMLQLAPGVRVVHETFGVGTIVSTKGGGWNAEATIDFGVPFGSKRLLVRYTPMRVLEENGEDN